MRRRFIAGCALATMIVASACSKSTAPSASSASQVPPAASAAASAAAPASEVAAYTAHDFGFDGPDTLAAGTSDITMENVGANDHEMVIIRLDKNQDWTEEQFVEYVKNDPKGQPKWAVPVGGAVPPVAPGESAKVQFMDFSAKQPVPIEGGSLEPGTYLLMCFVGKPPHAAMGMVKKITVG